MSFSKKILFSLVTLMLFGAVLLALEGTLRLTNYGGNQALFIADGDADSSRYHLNPNFMQRYFFKKGIQPPDPRSQSFKVRKTPATFRIFCLGASSTQGVPYPPNAAFPAMLGHILRSLHPQRDIEVINCGVTAITSHSVLDMGREIIDNYDPDLLVVYSGHNEFYGALGSASRLNLFESRRLTALFLGLQRSRLFLLLRNSYIALFGESISANEVIDPGTLMGTVARDAEIPFNGPLFKRTMRDYSANMSELVESANEAAVPIMLCNLVDNLRDLPPLGSQTSKQLNDASRQELLKQVVAGERLYNEGAYNAALRNLQVAIEIDSGYAGAHYWQAQNLLALGEQEKALRAFKRARDLDVIRFRAPSALNDSLRRISRRLRAPLVDAIATFRENSPQTIPGNNLILEHIHPNATGYYLLAKSIAISMAENEMMVPSWDWSRALSDSAYMELNMLTPLSHEVARMAAQRLRMHWPFTHNGRPLPPYRRVGTERTEELARLYIFEKNMPLAGLHLDYGFTLFREGKLTRARREYLAALAIEENCEAYNRLGMLETKQLQQKVSDGAQQEAAVHFKNAQQFYEKGLKLCAGHAPLHFNLGQLYALLPATQSRAEDYFEEALRLQPEYKNARIALLQMLLRGQRFAEAQTLLEDGIKLQPEEVSYLVALARLYAQKGERARAIESLQKALQLKPADVEILTYLNMLKQE